MSYVPSVVGLADDGLVHIAFTYGDEYEFQRTVKGQHLWNLGCGASVRFVERLSNDAVVTCLSCVVRGPAR